MRGARLARWTIAFVVVLFYAGGTYALTASGSPGPLTAVNSACVPAATVRADLTVAGPTTTTTTTTDTQTTTQLTTTTTTTTDTQTTAVLSTTTTTTTDTQTTTQPTTTTTTTTDTRTAVVPTTTTATQTTTQPTTTTETTTAPTTTTQQLLRTVTATATCTLTKTVPKPASHRPAIISARLIHSTVLIGQPAVALVYGIPFGTRVIVSISRGQSHLATLRFPLRHGPTKMTIPSTNVPTPGDYLLSFVVASGSERSRTRHLKLHVVVLKTTARQPRSARPAAE